MNKTIKIVIIVFIIFAALISAKLALRASAKAINNGHVVRLENPQIGELIEYVSAPGEIEPKTKVELSAKVSARIIEMPYEEGDFVTKGDPDADPPIPASVLVRLDAKDLESQLRSAEASLEGQTAQLEVEKSRIASQKATLVGLEARLEQSKRDYERQKGLAESQDISLAVYEQAELALNELQSQYESSKHSLNSAELGLIVLQHNLDAAKERVTEAKDNLTYTTITSPIDGVIIRKNAEVGEMVIYGTMNNPGTVIVEVADLSKMLVVAQVDEADIAKVKVGQNAIVEVDAFPDKEFKGFVNSVALSHTSSANGTKYFQTEILLDAVEEKLYSGLTAHVEIETRKHSDVLMLPTQAILGIDIDDLPLEIREPYCKNNQTRFHWQIIMVY